MALRKKEMAADATRQKMEAPTEGEFHVQRLAAELELRFETDAAIKRCAQHLIVMDEDLRKRIAVVLHDDVAQVIFAAGLNLSVITDRLPEDLKIEFEPLLQKSRMLADDVSRTVRNLMVDLCPPYLNDFGLAKAIRWYASEYVDRTGIAVVVNIDHGFPMLSVMEEVTIFRIIQEALNNVLKHAVAKKVSIDLDSNDDSTRISINDDGRGFLHQMTNVLPTGTGWGLTIMRERAELIDGIFRIDTVLEQGTSILLEIRKKTEAA